MNYTTPNSIIKLYKVPISPDLNGYIDDLEVYLGSIEDLDDSDYFAKYEIQYQKHALDLTVKIRTSESKQLSYDYNYCSIQNVLNDSGTKEERCYYFITNLVVKSSDAIELTLHLDTVNTLGQGAYSKCNPRNFLATTYIKRQHKDRFKKKLDHVPGTSVTLLREIDAVDEGIVPDKIKQSDTKLTTGQDLDWYLIYRTKTTQNNSPIETLLCASSELKINNATISDISVETNDLEQDKYYYIVSSNSDVPVSVKINNIEYTADNQDHIIDYWPLPVGPYGTVYGVTLGQFVGFCYYKENNSITIKGLYREKGEGRSAYLPTINIFSMSNFTEMVVKNTTKYFKSNDYTISFVTFSTLQGTWENYTPGTQESTISSIDLLDRSDSRLVKVIRYPYCPINYMYDETSQCFFFDSSWQMDSDLLFLKYTGNNIPLLGNNHILSLNVSDYVKLSIPAATQTDTADKNINAESKLFNSAFKTVKLTYDSFSLPIFWENYILYPYGVEDTTLTIDFKPTATINSSFGFKLNTEPLGVYQTVEDYGKYLLVTRNNEEVIYNDAYINYIKNGYNYDKKANALALEQAQRSATASTVGTALSTVGSIAALAAAPFTGGLSMAAAIPMITSSITGGISAANAWKNVGNLVENQENTMAAKLAQLKAQAASASGSDDVDLMSWYCDNRLHLIHYQPKLEWRQALYRAFDYTGYAFKRYGTPSVDTRIWYNFLQCSPMIEYEGSRKARNVWLEDLKNRYESGVTVFHNRNGRWNFTRQYEN